MRIAFAALLLLGACSTLPVSTSYLPAASYHEFIYAGKYDQAIQAGMAKDEAATTAYCAARINLNGFTPEQIARLDHFAMMPSPGTRKEAESLIKSRNSRLGIRNLDSYVTEKCTFKKA